MIKIKDEVGRVEKRFGDVEVGDTFRYNVGDVYIRVNLVEDGEEDEWNAVRLTDGDFFYFRTEDRVELVEIEATVLERQS